jgi:hypothetical protein
MKYRVSIDDNFHYTDESERIDSQTYDTAEAAQVAARDIVDNSLRHLYQPGFTPEKLYDYYTDFGEDPFIISDDEDCKFSAWAHAKSRCPSICAEMTAPFLK